MGDRFQPSPLSGREPCGRRYAKRHSLFRVLKDRCNVLLTGSDDAGKTRLLRALAHLPTCLSESLPLLVYVDFGALADADAEVCHAAMLRELFHALAQPGAASAGHEWPAETATKGDALAGLKLALGECHAQAISVTFLVDHFDGPGRGRLLEGILPGPPGDASSQPTASLICATGSPVSDLWSTDSGSGPRPWGEFTVCEYGAGDPF